MLLEEPLRSRALDRMEQHHNPTMMEDAFAEASSPYRLVPVRAGRPAPGALEGRSDDGRGRADALNQERGELVPEDRGGLARRDPRDVHGQLAAAADVRARSDITAKAKAADGEADFSERIREGLLPRPGDG